MDGCKKTPNIFILNVGIKFDLYVSSRSDHGSPYHRIRAAVSFSSLERDCKRCGQTFGLYRIEASWQISLHCFLSFSLSYSHIIHVLKIDPLFPLVEKRGLIVAAN